MRNPEIALMITGIVFFSIGCGNSNTIPATNRAATTPSNTNSTTAPSSTNGTVPPSNANKTPATQTQEPAIWANLPDLANKTPEEVENALGKATDVARVTEPPQEVPGENRTFDLANMKGALIVRFYKGKAAAFSINVPKGQELKTPEELGKLAGFDLAGKRPAKATDFVSQWNGQFGSAKFAEVTIGKGPKSDYNLVRARIQR